MVNPYQAPESIATERLLLGDEKYWVVRTTKLTFQEIRNVSANGFEIAIASALTMLRIPLPALCAFAFDLRELPDDQIPENAHHQIQPWASEAAESQMSFVFCYTLPNIGGADVAAAIFCSAERDVLMSVIYARMQVGATVIEKTKAALLSQMNDGNVLITTEAKPELLNPPYLLVERMPGHRLDTLLDKHHQRKADYPSPPWVWRNDEQIKTFCRTYEREISEFYVQRGLYVLATPEKLLKLHYRSQQTVAMVAPQPSPRRAGGTILWAAVLMIAVAFLVKDPRFQLSLLGIGLSGVVGSVIYSFVKRK